MTTVLDVQAPVVSNTRLSTDYNVIGLEAPAVGARVEPGQFVMVKPGHGFDPLLRRPFSVFEVLRDVNGRPTGISLLNKRIGVGTGWLYDVAVGDTIPCLGPLGRPFTPVDPPWAAWMVAGGVGLAPFTTLGEALARRGTRMTLFYGARRAAELFYLDFFERLGARLALATEDGSRGDRGRVSEPLERALAALPSTTPMMVYACGPEGMLAASARLARAYGRPSEVSVERVMGCGLGGCYSCVIPVSDGKGGSHLTRSCLAGPVFRGDDIVWDD